MWPSSTPASWKIGLVDQRCDHYVHNSSGVLDLSSGVERDVAISLSGVDNSLTMSSLLRPNPKGRRKYWSSPELVSGLGRQELVILRNMSTKAFYIETRSLGGLAWPQLMCCALVLHPNPKGRRKYRSSPELVSGPWSTRVAILKSMSTKAFYVETGSLGGLAWPQLMCCALDLLSADACKSCWW
jgi:hypothetical protein